MQRRGLPQSCRHKTVIALALTISAACVCAGQPAPPQPHPHNRKPPVEIRPELYLGWTEDQQPPQPRRLAWPLILNITASNTNNTPLAGPITMTAYEEIAGARFSLRELKSTTNLDSSTNHLINTSSPNVFEPITSAVITLQELEFAAHITPHGANTIRMRCYVKLHIKQNVNAQTFETISAIECRPGRNTVLAAFPGVILNITAAWSRDSPHLISR